MVGAQEVTAQLQQALADAARCASEESAQNYDALAQDLSDLEEVAKRACAAHTDSRALLARLRSGTALTADDISGLRLLVVGDAAYYVKYDEELDRCKAETARIVGEIGRLQSGELTADALMHLSVLCREGRSLLELVRHYLDSQDRVRRFEAAITGSLDQASIHALIEVIEDMTA
jgi:hypothetical protein